MQTLSLKFVKSAFSHIKQLSRMSSTGIPLANILQHLEEFAPLETAEPWDNVGLLVEPHNYQNVRKILLTNDLTESVMKEIVENQVNFVITYHPLIFSGMKRIVSTDWKSRIISECFAKGIAIFSPHTSWDAAENGVNKWLIEAVAMNYENLRPIIPNAKHPHLGAGKVCSLKEKITIEQSIANIKKYSGLNFLQVGLAKDATLNSNIETLAVCAGSGASVLKNAKTDLFVTGEMSHHEVLEANHNGTTCILMNHSNSERYFLSVFKDIFSPKLPGVQIIVSKNDADPLKTY